MWRGERSEEDGEQVEGGGGGWLGESLVTACLTARLFEVWDPLLRSQHFDIRAQLKAIKHSSFIYLILKRAKPLKEEMFKKPWNENGQFYLVTSYYSPVGGSQWQILRQNPICLFEVQIFATQLPLHFATNPTNHTTCFRRHGWRVPMQQQIRSSVKQTDPHL